MISEEEPVRSELLSERIYGRIRRWIVEGNAKPGDRLVESEIARRLEVSQAPVREAIKRLVHEGLVTHRPRRGSFVTEVSTEQSTSAREIRVLLEELAARRLTEEGDREVIAALRADVAAMRKAATAGDIATFRDLDLAFHARVCNASGNSFMPRIWQLMEPSLRSLNVVSDPRYSGDWKQMAAHHAELVDAIESGNPDEAARLFRAHASGEQSKSRRRS